MTSPDTLQTVAVVLLGVISTSSTILAWWWYRRAEYWRSNCEDLLTRWEWALRELSRNEKAPEQEAPE